MLHARLALLLRLPSSQPLSACREVVAISRSVVVEEGADYIHRMIFRVSAIARNRGAAIVRRQMSTEVSTTSTSSGGAMNAFARGWYNLYVEIYVDLLCPMLWNVLTLLYL